MSDKDQTLLKELDSLFEDMQNRINKSSFLGKNIAEKLAPIQEIMVFVGKVVRKVEKLEKENLFLKEELAQINEELAQQNIRLLQREKNEKH